MPSGKSKVHCTGIRAQTNWPAVQFGMPLCSFIPGLDQHKEKAEGEQEEERKSMREGEQEREGHRMLPEGSQAHYAATKFDGSQRREGERERERRPKKR